MEKLSSPIELIKKAINIFTEKENLLFLIKIYIPAAVFSAIYLTLSFLPAPFRESNQIWLDVIMGFLQILTLLTGVFVTVAGIVALDKIIGKGGFSVLKTYKIAWKKYWTLLLLSIILVLIYFVGFILLIVPGIIFVVWFAFSRFVGVEKNLGVKDSLLRSREMVKGIYWKVLGRLIVFGAFTLVIQIVLTVIPYGAGSIVSSFCGGLYMLPVYLLYKELDALKNI
jgi:hypothetical protein